MAVRLSWLENTYSRPLLSAGDFVILIRRSRSDWPSFWCRIGVH